MHDPRVGEGGRVGRLRRFRAEAQAVAALNHPNVLTIHEVGTQGEHPFIATELLDGATLRAALEAGALPHLNDLGDPAVAGLSVVNGQMYFAAFETRSNVWMAERRDGTP